MEKKLCSKLTNDGTLLSQGGIEVTGNRHFSRSNIIASLPVLARPESPNTQALADAIKVANKHPSKQVQVTFKPGKTPDQLDAAIAVAEHRPYQASLIANNYGITSSGDYRLTGALQYSNLWGLDHIVNGSYSTSPDHADSVQQYGGSYSLPVYRLKGWLSAYYANSSVNTGTVATDLTVTGSGEMYGIHYQQYLPKLGKYEHSLDFGIDNRYFINLKTAVEHSGIPFALSLSKPVMSLSNGGSGIPECSPNG